jgi:SAM-dependent methyltransferase
MNKSIAPTPSRATSRNSTSEMQPPPVAPRYNHPLSDHPLPDRILDVGCGINKRPGSIGIDRNPASRADVLVDLDRFPYPFKDSSFDALQAVHVIEHVSDVIRTMEEFHRLVRPGGEVFVVTPHYTDFSSFCDPTHRWHLNSFSLRYFGEDNAGYGYYSSVRFREISTRVKLLALWRWLGFELLVNAFPHFRRFWEYYLCYVVRGKVIEWRLGVIKGAGS